MNGNKFRKLDDCSESFIDLGTDAVPFVYVVTLLPARRNPRLRNLVVTAVRSCILIFMGFLDFIEIRSSDSLTTPFSTRPWEFGHWIGKDQLSFHLGKAISDKIS